jgi:hypothetical protein
MLERLKTVFNRAKPTHCTVYFVASRLYDFEKNDAGYILSSEETAVYSRLAQPSGLAPWQTILYRRAL